MWYLSCCAHARLHNNIVLMTVLYISNTFSFHLILVLWPGSTLNVHVTGNQFF
jgi:hypothetical protein